MRHPLRLAVTVKQTQRDKPQQRASTREQQITLTHGRRSTTGEPGPDAVAQGNHADPRHYRVGSAQAQAVGKLDPAPVMQNRPRHMQRRACSKVQRVEQVMPGDDANGEQ